MLILLILLISHDNIVSVYLSSGSIGAARKVSTRYRPSLDDTMTATIKKPINSGDVITTI